MCAQQINVSERKIKPDPKDKPKSEDKPKELIIPDNLRIPFTIQNAQMLPNRIWTRGDYGSSRYKARILSFDALVSYQWASNLPIVALLSTSLDRNILEAYRPDGKHTRHPELDLVIDIPVSMYLDPKDPHNKKKFKSPEDFIFDLSQELRWRIIYREPGTNRPIYKDFKTEQDAWDFILMVEDSTKPFPLLDL